MKMPGLRGYRDHSRYSRTCNRKKKEKAGNKERNRHFPFMSLKDTKRKKYLKNEKSHIRGCGYYQKSLIIQR